MATPASMAGAGGTPVKLISVLIPRFTMGRFVNNAWCQEASKPLSRHTWDNVIFMSPAMAKRMGFFVLEQGPVSQTTWKKT